ncbi:MAG: ABC transporter ATP-binding protein, partial [Clostridia bacterium]|nr:ABC transporter ATP-binding protein [Clostridia bacterium]
MAKPSLTPMKRNHYQGVPKPKSLRDVPRYLKELLGGFFTRFFYIVKLVWEAKPALMLAMVLFCVLNGVLPVVGAYISAELVNEISLQLHLSPESVGGFWANVGANFSLIFLLLLASFTHLFCTRLFSRLSGMVNTMAGEVVANHIKLKILNKAKTVDMASFDRPEFYEKMENANREAGMRPLRIIEATFSILSALISCVSFVVILVGLHPAAPWIIVILSIPTAVINYMYRRKNFHFMRFHSKERREMNYYSSVVVDKDKAKEMRIMGLSDTFIDRYSKTFRRYYKGLRRLIVNECLWQVGVSLLTLLGHCALFLFVAYTVVYGQGRDLAEYSLYTTALTSIGTYVSTLISATATIYEGTLFIDNMIT